MQEQRSHKFVLLHYHLPVPGEILNTQPISLVFKQLPRDLANVNE